MRTLIGILLLSGLPTALAGQQPGRTPNTLSRDPAQSLPAATVADLAWLAGHWQGPSLGGTSEEIWSPAAAGTMMGVYRLIRNETIIFYEIMTLQQEGDGVVLLLKHFNPDLTGWEERDEVVRFPLLGLTPTHAYFDGMTFHRLDVDRVVVHVAIDMADGSVREEEFPYTRVRDER